MVKRAITSGNNSKDGANPGRNTKTRSESFAGKPKCIALQQIHASAQNSEKTHMENQSKSAAAPRFKAKTAGVASNAKGGKSNKAGNSLASKTSANNKLFANHNTSGRAPKKEKSFLRYIHRL